MLTSSNIWPSRLHATMLEADDVTVDAAVDAAEARVDTCAIDHVLVDWDVDKAATSVDSAPTTPLTWASAALLLVTYELSAPVTASPVLWARVMLLVCEVAVACSGEMNVVASELTALVKFTLAATEYVAIPDSDAWLMLAMSDVDSDAVAVDSAAPATDTLTETAAEFAKGTTAALTAPDAYH